MTVHDRQPWSVRGIAREARAKAARAAHRRRMTIGEWVTETILAAADRDLGLTDGQPAPVAQGALPATRETASGELTGALGALVRHLEVERSEGSMAEVARRVERSEMALTGRMEQIAAALYAVMQTIERNAMKTVEPDDPPGTGHDSAIAAEQARLAEQVAAIARAEDRRQDQMAAIAEALTLLAGKLEAPAHKAEPEAPAAPEAEAKPKPEADTKPEPEAAAKPEPEVAAKPEPEADTKPRPEADVKPEPEADVKPTAGPAAPAPPPPAEDVSTTQELKTEPRAPAEPRLEPHAVAPRRPTEATPRQPAPPREPVVVTARPAGRPQRDPRGAEQTAQHRPASLRPRDFDDDEPPRRGLFSRLFRRDD